MFRLFECLRFGFRMPRIAAGHYAVILTPLVICGWCPDTIRTRPILLTSGWACSSGSPKTHLSKFFSPESLLFLAAQHGLELVAAGHQNGLARNTR